MKTFAALLVIGALLGGCGSEERASGDPDRVAGTTASIEDLAAGTTARAAPPPPAPTLADARAAVAGDNYSLAIAIVTALGAAKADAIRRIIANRIARRAQDALSSGDRDAAGMLLRLAGRAYPTTQQVRRVRANLQGGEAAGAGRRSLTPRVRLHSSPRAS